MYITIDCGTTNMRARLFDGNEFLCETRRQAGVRNTAFSGSADFLRSALTDCILELLNTRALAPRDIEAVLCAGTLSSDVGIYRVPHGPLPAGIRESAKNAKLVKLPDITSIPLFFIPGIKVVPDATREDELSFIYQLESLSGEDIETYGIMEEMGLHGPFVIALPGSYLKVLHVNEAGQVTFFTTGMCGEFLAAMSEHTLLKHSLPHPLIDEPDEKYLCLGYDYCERYGASPSLIKGRMMPFLGGYGARETANFYVGAALHDDVGLIRAACTADKALYIGGSNPLRHVFSLLCAHAGVCAAKTVEIPDDAAKFAPNIGAIRVYEAWKKENA